MERAARAAPAGDAHRVGGCGKTRLALQVRRAGGPVPDGVWLVDLGRVADPALVPGGGGRARVRAGRPAAAARRLPCTCAAPAAAGAGQLRAPARRLRAELVDALLRACPEVRVLATSREPLGVAGETAWRVPSPMAEAAAGGRGGGCSSSGRRVRARVRRRRRQRRRRGEVCRRLDGIPLAIELAAAGCGADGRADPGAAGRPLPAADRRPHGAAAPADAAGLGRLELRPAAGRPSGLFRRLSVFAGGWTLEAAEAVCAGRAGGRGARPARPPGRQVAGAGRPGRRRGAVPAAGDDPPVRARPAAGAGRAAAAATVTSTTSSRSRRRPSPSSTCATRTPGWTGGGRARQPPCRPRLGPLVRRAGAWAPAGGGAAAAVDPLRPRATRGSST